MGSLRETVSEAVKRHGGRVVLGGLALESMLIAACNQNPSEVSLGVPSPAAAAAPKPKEAAASPAASPAAKPEIASVPTAKPEPTPDLVSVPQYSNDREARLRTATAVLNYQRFDTNYKYEDYRDRRRKGETKEALFEEAVRHLVAANMFIDRKRGYVLGNFAGLPQTDTITFGGTELNLKDRTDLTVAQALIEVYIKYGHPTLNANTQSPTSVDYLDKLRTLRGKIKIEDNDSDPFVPARPLAILADVLKTLEQQGKPIPRNWRQEGFPEYRPNTDTLTFRASDLVASLPHYYLDIEPDLLQDYKNAVGEVAKKLPVSENPRFLSVWSVGIPDDDETDFRGTMGEFLDGAVKIRRRIEYAKLNGYPEAEVLERKYNFIKDWLGVDLRIWGQVVDATEPKVGDFAKIYDFDRAVEGVVLKSEPTASRDIRSHIARDGDLVRVLAGPVSVVYGYGDATKMYRVQVGEFIQDGRIWIPKQTRPDEPSPEGWISAMDYLQLLPPKE